MFLEDIFYKMFGSPNDRQLKKLQPMVDRINGLESTFEPLDDDASV